MFHILKDEETIVAVLANVTTQQIQEAVVKDDHAFRRWVDCGVAHCADLMCQDLGIAWASYITDYNEVLVALLVDGGATHVNCQVHDTTPAVSAERTEEDDVRC